MFNYRKNTKRELKHNLDPREVYNKINPTKVDADQTFDCLSSTCYY